MSSPAALLHAVPVGKLVAVSAVCLAIAARRWWRRQQTELRDLCRQLADARADAAAWQRFAEVLVPLDAAGKSAVLHRFDRIRNNTQCLFAARSRIHAAPELSLEDTPTPDSIRATLYHHAGRCVPPLLVFVTRCVLDRLDGFVIEIPVSVAVEARGAACRLADVNRCVRLLLHALADADPAPSSKLRHAMKDAGLRGWQFSFAGVYLFVTVFAPCYPATSSRYAFSATDAVYVLFQPLSSFTHERIGPPGSEQRQRILHNFRAHGRPFHLPRAKVYPQAWNVVKPLHDADPVNPWWLEPGQRPEYPLRAFTSY